MAYDDFEDGTIDKWTAVDITGGTMVASTSANKFGSYGGRMTTDGAGDWGRIEYSNPDINGTTSYNVYAWVRTSDASSEIKYYLFSVGHDEMQIRINADQFFYYIDVGLVAFTITPSDNTWYRFRIKWDAVGHKISYYIYNTTNTLLEEHLDQTPYSTVDPTNVYIGGRDVSASVVTVDWDNVCITDTTEPTAAAKFHIFGKYWWKK